MRDFFSSSGLSPVLVFSSLALLLLSASCHPALAFAEKKPPLPKPEKPVRNLILLIGDGMGPQQVALASLYAKYAPNSKVPNRQLHLQRLIDRGETGLSINKPKNGLVIDSACSATQLATGVPALSETIGVDSRGNTVKTILEKAAQSGRSTGLVSDTRITHATPAAFYAHVKHRSFENDIAVAAVNSKANVLLSAGTRHFLPKEAADQNSPTFKRLRDQLPGHIKITSERKDSRNLLNEARQRGFQLAFDRKTMQSVQKGRLLGLFAHREMVDGITHTQKRSDQNRTEPTLKEMSIKAIELLSQNKKGFFLMIEGGQIDWAAHLNDTGYMLHELLKFDEAIGAVLDWAEKRDDTLVVLTADHETGSFGFSYSGKDLPGPQKLPGDVFKNSVQQSNFNFGEHAVLDQIYNQKMNLYSLVFEFERLPAAQQTAAGLSALVKKHTGFVLTKKQAQAILQNEPNEFYQPGHRYLGLKEVPRFGAYDAFYPYPNNRRAALIARAIADQQNVVWGSGTHTSTPVLVVADGPRWAEKWFDGLHSAYYVGDSMIRALGLPSNR